MKGILKLENGKEVSVNIDEKTLQGCIVQAETKTEYNRWRAEVGKDYFYVDSCGHVYSSTEEDDSIDDKNYLRGNYFKTKKEAESFDQKKWKIQMIQDRITAMNKGWIPNWNDDKQQKYYIGISHKLGELEVVYARSFQVLPNSMYFEDEIIGEMLIRDYRYELNDILYSDK